MSSKVLEMPPKEKMRFIDYKISESGKIVIAMREDGALFRNDANTFSALWTKLPPCPQD